MPADDSMPQQSHQAASDRAAAKERMMRLRAERDAEWAACRAAQAAAAAAKNPAAKLGHLLRAKRHVAAAQKLNDAAQVALREWSGI